MKERSLFCLTVILAILGISSLPVLAISDSQRYPTAAEIQQLIRQFRRDALSPSTMCCNGSEKDPRSPATRRLVDSFVRAWSRVNPEIAPFLGRWVNNNEIITVYPSNVRGRGCVIFSIIGEDFFSIGSPYRGHLRLNDGEIANRMLVRQHNQFGTPFILMTGVYERVPNYRPYGLAYTPDPPAPFLSTDVPQARARILQQFNAAGCTASLPKRR